MEISEPVVVFWFRRDLRLEDNAGLYHALKSGYPVLPLFIFDTQILNKLPDKDDARVSFIHSALITLDEQLKEKGSSMLVKYGNPADVFTELIAKYQVKCVYTNEDYEPYARDRDKSIAEFLKAERLQFLTFKDQVIFSKEEVIKNDGTPYTVFTPYKRRWLEVLDTDFHFKPYPSLKYCGALLKFEDEVPPLANIGFIETDIEIPGMHYQNVLPEYHSKRDFPAVEGTSRIGVHLRFGTVSIRQLAREAYRLSEVWLSELIWREFYSMILWHFPHTVHESFKKDYDKIIWRNNEAEFLAWTEGQTGYPIVDAGMRQLNATGWMHNRVRMVVASFLCKHLLIDWRWGEAYFARKLLDYEQASNVGGWQWAAGTGNDAAPYFRVFNPELQAKRFDPKFEYIKKWIPEIEDPFKYPKPIVEHKFARDRALKAYAKALGN